MRIGSWKLAEDNREARNEESPDTRTGDRRMAIRPNQNDEWKFNIYFKKGDLVITTASAKSKWSDWRLIHR